MCKQSQSIKGLGVFTSSTMRSSSIHFLGEEYSRFHFIKKAIESEGGGGSASVERRKISGSECHSFELISKKAPTPGTRGDASRAILFCGILQMRFKYEVVCYYLFLFLQTIGGMRDSFSVVTAAPGTRTHVVPPLHLGGPQRDDPKNCICK